MISLPNCKINIGLDVLLKRSDGYHELESVMLPVQKLCDVLEIVRGGDGFEFSSGGLDIDCPPEKNICHDAYRLMKDRFGIGSVKMHLHKIVPFGAGLGGGSADGAFAIKGIDNVFGLGLSDGEMEELSAKLGSDTAFFIRDIPQIARGRGEILCPVELSLAGKTLVIVKPPFGVSTAEAYSGIEPRMPLVPLGERIAFDISQWREHIANAFEPHIFLKYPQLSRIKEMLYSLGAEYASMSGSGSAMYGIFDQEPAGLPEAFPGMFVHQEVMM